MARAAQVTSLPVLAAELSRQPSYKDELERRARPAVAAAKLNAEQAGAPWMDRPAEPTIVMERTPLGVRITNTDFGAWLMEFGSINNPPHGILRRAIRAARLRFIPSETT